jgi:flagellar assembly factor FliW
VFKRIFFPISVIMGIFDAVKGALAGFEEGGIIGGIRGALIGLFDGIIGGAVNMITGALSWILDKLGFDKAAEALAAFDITEYFTMFIDGIGNMISGAFNWIKGVFAGIDIVGGLTSMWEAYASTVGSIMDIIFKPVDMAINWIMGIFGFETPEGGFSLKDMIFDTIGKVKDFFFQLFDFLPSLDTIKSAITNLLPDWLKPDEEINVATANEEQLRAMANDNAGFFGNEEEEYQKLVAQKKAAIDAQLSNTPADFIRQQTQDTEATGILNTPADFIRQQTQDTEATGILNTRPSDYVAAESLNTRPSDYVAVEALERPVPLLEKQRSLSANESEMKAAAAAPIIINNNNSGGGQKAGNTNNVSSATYNISQGVSADDFVRMDFANRY